MSIYTSTTLPHVPLFACFATPPHSFPLHCFQVTGTGVNPAAPVGPQRDIFTKNTATIQGQVWTAPIAPKFTLQASSYSYDSTTSLTTVYVRATAPAGIVSAVHSVWMFGVPGIYGADYASTRAAQPR